MSPLSRPLLITLTVALAALAPSGSPAASSERGYRFPDVRFDRDAVRGGGDPRGKGTFGLEVAISPGHPVMFWRFDIFATQRPTAFHVHRARAGRVGPVVKRIQTWWSTPSRPWLGSNSWSGGTFISRSFALALARHPAAYYIDFHTSRYPRGVARAQLRGPARPYRR